MRASKSAKPDFTNSPFKALEGMLKKRNPKRVPQTVLRPVKAVDDGSEEPAEAQKLFLEAVADVIPIPADRSAIKQDRPAPPASLLCDDENELALMQLKELVVSGQGFVVADTPEYIEGMGQDVPPELLRRLHRGDFSIQAYIDLHGCTVAEAREVFQGFLTESVKRGKRSLLIVHGRGLSSAAEPVIKNRIVEWLNSSRWRKWVIAYASARSCDGGAGATCVLLRPHPFAKGRRKKRP